MDRTTPPLERAARRTTREPSALVAGDCLVYTGQLTAEGYPRARKAAERSAA